MKIRDVRVRPGFARHPAVAHLIEPTGAELVPYTSTLPVTDNDWRPIRSP